MKIFSFKKGTEVIANWLFWILFAIAVAVVGVIIANISNISVEEASKIPVGLEELILASRFYNSEKCFAYQDEFEIVHTKSIDKSEFTKEKLDTCFPGDNTEQPIKYSFSLRLLPLPDPINTTNWIEGGPVIKEIKEDVFIFDNDVKTRGTLIVEIQNVE